jgi:two-component system alkaline phosphatase synthesis response regulator PhoP
MKKILIIEDEDPIRIVLEDDFRDEGYMVESASDGIEGLEKSLNIDIDLIILDIMLPGMDGFEICKKLRMKGIDTPIIMLTAKGQEIDRVLCLEIGADDYVTKPFSPRELQARVKAILRWIENHAENKAYESYRMMGLEVDFRNYRCTKTGKEINLTIHEFGILKYLICNKGRAINRDELLDEVWGRNVLVTPRSVDTHIANLRKKIEDNPANPKLINSVHGFGYRFFDG